MIGPSRHNSIRDGLELCDYFSRKGEIDTEIQIESLEADEGGKALNDLKFRFAKLQLALAYNIKEVLQSRGLLCIENSAQDFPRFIDIPHNLRVSVFH